MAGLLAPEDINNWFWLSVSSYILAGSIGLVLGFFMKNMEWAAMVPIGYYLFNLSNKEKGEGVHRKYQLAADRDQKARDLLDQRL